MSQNDSLFWSTRIGSSMANHLIQNGTSKCMSQITWFRTGLQSACRKSFDSERDFKVRVANHLIQNRLQSACRCIHPVYIYPPYKSHPVYTYIYIYIYVTPRVHTATTRRSGSRTRDSGAGGGRSNKERQRLQPLASVARAPLFEVRRVRFTHSPYWHSYIRYIYTGCNL